MKKHTRILLLCFCVSGTAAGVAPAAVVAGTDGALSQTVSYADLDLTRPAGARVLFRRISAAAQQVCAPFRFQEHSDLAQRQREQACIDKAIGTAVQDVNSAALNDLQGKHVGQVARN